LQTVHVLRVMYEEGDKGYFAPQRIVDKNQFAYHA
jgi:hypothetical protein